VPLAEEHGVVDHVLDAEDRLRIEEDAAEHRYLGLQGVGRLPVEAGNGRRDGVHEASASPSRTRRRSCRSSQVGRVHPEFRSSAAGW
jgi:hypothetical protein